MRRFIDTIILVILFALTNSCGTHYYDTIQPEVSTMEIPSEGGGFSFKLVNYVYEYSSRFQPGETYKYYCYRVVEDGVIGDESEKMFNEECVWIEFAPNTTNHTKEYTIDVKVADDYYKFYEKPHFGEWQTVWKIAQPSASIE